MMNPILLILLGLQTFHMTGGSGFIDCRTACRQCRDGLVSNDLLEVYCSMCKECRDRRRERTAIFKNSIVPQTTKIVNAPAHPSAPKAVNFGGGVFSGGKPPLHKPTFRATEKDDHWLLGKHGNKLLEGWPEGCPTPPICSEEETEPPTTTTTTTRTTTTPTTTTTAPKPTCPPIDFCLPKKKTTTPMPAMQPCIPCIPPCSMACPAYPPISAYVPPLNQLPPINLVMNWKDMDYNLYDEIIKKYSKNTITGPHPTGRPTFTNRIPIPITRPTTYRTIHTLLPISPPDKTWTTIKPWPSSVNPLPGDWQVDVPIKGEFNIFGQGGINGHIHAAGPSIYSSSNILNGLNLNPNSLNLNLPPAPTPNHNLLPAPTPNHNLQPAPTPNYNTAVPNVNINYNGLPNIWNNDKKDNPDYYFVYVGVPKNMVKAGEKSAVPQPTPDDEWLKLL